MNRNEILAILESFNNKYGTAAADDRRKAVETILAKKGIKIGLAHDAYFGEALTKTLFEEWINNGTPGSVPEWIVDSLYHAEADKCSNEFVDFSAFFGINEKEKEIWRKK